MGSIGEKEETQAEDKTPPTGNTGPDDSATPPYPHLILDRDRRKSENTPDVILGTNTLVSVNLKHIS